ncbi:glycolipid transfer protein domain-containing protein 2 [Strongylocentrotus purpuratus]|uniref:Glycolipid transfer protein domain-containing protein n=1 Tax=Strongylocentrotus purpuratus TaxID=7668 RepID=A0A7M7RFE6_STRPU|nr:glycolipid transfer protein domain-containing protein 2 [Strongylocentrotus purpuratus]|eukprot:XP_798633.1 PREDICTED: glycolipid transfer protein domain-containing protein 2 [Strongylocentrotus purpuratus]
MDVTVVRNNFTAAKSAAGDVDFEPFLKGYDEIARLYDSMGQVFHFASKDMRSRIKTVNNLTKEDGSVYTAVVKALDHEKAQGIKKKTKGGVTAASKILLEMHWDVAFFILIMKRMGEAQDDTKMSQVARKAYDDSLAPHNALPIRTAARLACKTLPIRKDFVEKYLKQNTAEAVALLPATIGALKAIHSIMEAAFIKNDLMKEAEAEAARNKAEDATQPGV